MSLRTIILILVLILFGCKEQVKKNVIATPKTAPTSIAGFNDFKWDISKQSVKSLMKGKGTKFADENDLVSYDYFKFGDESVRILFYFNSNKLYKIGLSRQFIESSTAKDVYDKYKSVYVEKYGQPKPADFPYDDLWKLDDGNKILLANLYMSRTGTWFFMIDYINGNTENSMKQEAEDKKKKDDEINKKKILKDI